MKRTTMLLIWLTLLGLLTLPACSSPVAMSTQVPATDQPKTSEATQPPPSPTPTTEPFAALVNGQPITLAEYERQVASYETSMTAAGQDPNTPEGQATLAQNREWVLDQMIDQVLIVQAAGQAGVIISDAELDATIRSLRDEIGEDAFQQWLQNEGMSLDEMRERLRSDMTAGQMANRIADERVPTRTEHVHARHILVSTEEEARQILAQLQAGADFVTLAQAYSQDISTRDTGGDLGFFPKGILTSPEVEAVAFSLQPGQISDVVPSALGFHIVQVVERVPDMEISADNLRLLRDKAVQEWVVSLRAAAQIERFISTAP
jgi:parvulin-like peptidyl-prolyl isomerase